MSKETIYGYLRQGGLTHSGACAMMGNMYCESLLKSNIVEKRCTLSDEEYTNAVNTGTISCYIFARDSFGYGLCQWTFWTRKEELWKRTVGNGISISDEMAQCEFCILELKRDNKTLYDYLCSSDCDLYTATARICKEYERPAVNNIDARYAKAKEYDRDLQDSSYPPAGGSDPTQHTDTTDSEAVTIRVLRKGDKGNDVHVLQLLLNDKKHDVGVWGCDGVFGDDTERALNDFKEECNLPADGMANADVWQVMFQ